LIKKKKGLFKFKNKNKKIDLFELLNMAGKENLFLSRVDGDR